MPDPTNPPAPATPPAGNPPNPTPPAAPTPEPAAPKPGDGKSKEEPNPAQPPQKVVPEKYDLKLPEGSQLDATHIEKVAALAKERKLSNEEAQAIIDRDNATISGFADGQNKQLKERQDAWVKDSQNDKEFGGEAFAKNAELAKRVVERFGSDALKTALNDTGLGNHPELLRVFVRIGKAMSEDQLVLPGSTQSTAEKKSVEDIFYPPKKEQ